MRGSELDSALGQLRRLTADNSPQRAFIADLARVAGEKMAELELTVTLRRERDLNAALEVILTDRGRNLMREARRIADESIILEGRLLTQRTEASQAAVRETVSTFALTTGMAHFSWSRCSYCSCRCSGANRGAVALRKSEA